MQQGLKVIITGSTGMVGEGILLVFKALINPAISNILIINRKPLGSRTPN